MVSQVAQARTSTTSLCSQMAFEAVKLGPMAQMYMARRAAPYMLSGIVPAGAAQVIAATDYSQEATASIARMTAIMVSRSSSGHRVVLRRHDTRTWYVPTMHVWQNAQWHPLHLWFTMSQVKLGFVKLVASITSQCVRQDRQDSVAKASTYLHSSLVQQPLAACQSVQWDFMLATHEACTGRRRCLSR